MKTGGEEGTVTVEALVGADEEQHHGQRFDSL